MSHRWLSKHRCKVNIDPDDLRLESEEFGKVLRSCAPLGTSCCPFWDRPMLLIIAMLLRRLSAQILGKEVVMEVRPELGTTFSRLNKAQSIFPSTGWRCRPTTMMI